MNDDFTLQEFTEEAWMTRPRYVDCDGIGYDYLVRLHERTHHLPLLEVVTVPYGRNRLMFVAFVHADDLKFEIFLYEVNSFHLDMSPSKLDPCFDILGNTFDGIGEVQACPSVGAMPCGIRAQMKWVESYCEARGWAVQDA